MSHHKLNSANSFFIWPRFSVYTALSVVHKYKTLHIKIGRTLLVFYIPFTIKKR